MTETLAHGYSSESSQPEPSNEYQHDRVKMFFKNLCFLLIWTKVASSLKGLNGRKIEKRDTLPTILIFSPTFADDFDGPQGIIVVVFCFFE